jgi:hypothetical protein
MTHLQKIARRRSDAEVDRRIAASELRLRQQQRDLDERINRDLAARTPERIAQDNAELARLDVVATEESRRREERLAQRRNATNDTFGT